MAAVADLERLLERVFERTSARLFRSRVQAVQVERRVERAMEAARTGRGSATSVPSRYRVRLHPADLDDLAARTGGAESLAGQLAERAFAFARLHAYHLAARPTVSVVADPSVERGRVEVDAVAGAVRAVIPPGAVPAMAAPTPPPAAIGVPVVVPIGADGSIDRGRDVSAAPSPVVASVAASTSMAPAGAPSATAAASTATPTHEVAQPEADPSVRGLRGDRRSTIRPAAPPPPRALLRVSEPGGRERELRLEGAPLTLGRAPDNSLVIADRRVSRHHGRFQTRNGTLVYTDLGSTNGTRVNGIRVDEIVLGAGDRLQLGDVVVVVEQLPG